MIPRSLGTDFRVQPANVVQILGQGMTSDREKRLKERTPECVLEAPASLRLSHASIAQDCLKLTRHSWDRAEHSTETQGLSRNRESL